MPTSPYFRQPNAQAYRYADTGRDILQPGELPHDTVRLGSATGAPYTPGVVPVRTATSTTSANPSDAFSVLRKTRNPALEALNLQAQTRYGADVAANDTALADFSKALLANTEANKKALDQETHTIDDVFSGKLASDLAGIRSRYGESARRKTDDAIASANMERKAAAVGSGMGGSSYFARQGAALRSEAGSKLATDLADRELRDVQYVRDAQGRLVGVRRKLGNELAQDSLLPMEARLRSRDSELRNLGALGALDERNNFYGLDDGQGNAPFFPQYAPTSGYRPRDVDFGGDDYRPRNRQPRYGSEPQPRTTSRISTPSGHDYFSDSNFDLDPNLGWVPHSAPLNLPDNLYDLTPDQQREYIDRLGSVQQSEMDYSQYE